MGSSRRCGTDSAWAIGFLAGLGVPGTVDGGARRPAWTALLIDAGLLLVFAAQHSAMARAGLKRRMARILPASAERSTYVLAASLTRWPAHRGPYESPPFRERWLYAWVRHPMMAGLLIAFWATPPMTAGHLFFAVAGTARTEAAGGS